MNINQYEFITWRDVQRERERENLLTNVTPDLPWKFFFTTIVPLINFLLRCGYVFRYMCVFDRWNALRGMAINTYRIVPRTVTVLLKLLWLWLYSPPTEGVRKKGISHTQKMHLYNWFYYQKIKIKKNIYLRECPCYHINLEEKWVQHLPAFSPLHHPLNVSGWCHCHNRWILGCFSARNNQSNSKKKVYLIVCLPNGPFLTLKESLKSLNNFNWNCSQFPAKFLNFFFRRIHTCFSAKNQSNSKKIFFKMVRF